MIPKFGCVKFIFNLQWQRIIKELSGAVKCRVYGAAVHEFGFIKLFPRVKLDQYFCSLSLGFLYLGFVISSVRYV